MSYQTWAAGPYPLNWFALCAGIAAINDVVVPAPLSFCQLTSLLLFAIDPAVDGSFTPLFLRML
jgi:hypothetical protein